MRYFMESLQSSSSWRRLCECPPQVKIFDNSLLPPLESSIMAIQEKIIRIGVGTTNSVVSGMEGGEVKVIANQDGNRILPSVVAYTEKGDRLVGDPAKRQAV